MTQAFQEVGITYMQNDTKLAGHANFHQTEAGVIPIDWTAKQLKEVFALKNGYSFKGEFFSNDGPIVLTPGNFKLEGGLYFEARNTKRYCAEYPKGYEFEKGDLVVVMTDLTPDCNLLGKPAFVDFDEKVLHNQRIGKITQLVKNWDRRFLYYTLLSPAYLSNIKNAATGSTVRHTSPNTISGTWIAEPPAVEQTAIANALSDVDALIQELEKLIAKKQAIKTATMQQLLTGRTRLPQFAHHPDGRKKGYKPSELGEIPEDWEIVSFEQLKDKRDGWAITGGPFGSNLKASDYTDDGIRVIQLQNIGDGFFKNSEFVFTSQKKADDLISCNIYPGDIILSKMGDPVARACLIPSFHSRYLMCSDGIRLKVDSQRFSEKFVFYFLNFPLFRNQALDASTGSTRKRIGLSELRDLLLFSPSKEEQTDIATTLSNMDDEIQSLEQRLNKTRQIRQGMMQELLTGKTRLI